MKDEFRKSMKKVKEKITVDAKIRGDGGVLERVRLCLLAVMGKRGALNETQLFRLWRGM